MSEITQNTDYQVQWTPELREAVDNRIIGYLQQGYSQQEAEEKALQDQLDHTTFNYPEVTVSAQAPVQKQVATESDWDPGYTKFMSGERYYADQDHKNYLDWQRNDYTRGIRETTDKWGKGIGLGMVSLAALPVASGAMAGINAGLNAFKTASPLAFNIAKTGLNMGLSADGVRNTLSKNGIQKTYSIGRDMYENGITGDSAWKFTKSLTGDVLDIAGGVGLAKDIVKGANYVNSLYKSGRLKGLWDQTKYGIYDRWQGYNIYKNMSDATGIHSYKPYDSSHNKAIEDIYTIGGKQRQGLPLTPSEFDLAKDMPFTSGRHMDDFDHLLSTNWKDAHLNNTSFTFMGNYDYLRNEDYGTLSKRGWRMGFTPQQGTVLPKAFTAANKQAIANAPSGSFISADAMGLTIPESMEVMQRWGDKPMKTLFNGSWMNSNPSRNYGMSADAYRFFTKQGQLPGNKVVYAGQHGLFNNAAVRNTDIYNWQEAYRSGQMTAKQYVDKFNNWTKEFGGRPGHVDFKTGQPYFYHPVIYKQKQGGKINYLNYFN